MADPKARASTGSGRGRQGPLIAILLLLAWSAALAAEPESLHDGPAMARLQFDHGRLLVDGDISLHGASWRPLRLWIGGRELDLSRVSRVDRGAPSWIFAATGADANLPATVLMNYRVTFDFPGRTLALAAPGEPAGPGPSLACNAGKSSGIVTVDASLGGSDLSLAIDLGASYSFLDADALRLILDRHPEWPRMTGSAGAANMWGWFFPSEEAWMVVRSDALSVGKGAVSARIAEPAFVALPRKSVGSLAAWYSAKTPVPVAGFLGPNIFRGFRLVIDWPSRKLQLERVTEDVRHDLDSVGIAIRPEPDGGWAVVTIARRKGKPLAAGLSPGDRLVSIDGHPLSGLTMGAVSGFLGGRPGDRRIIVVERAGMRLSVMAQVERMP